MITVIFNDETEVYTVDNESAENYIDSCINQLKLRISELDNVRSEYPPQMWSKHYKTSLGHITRDCDALAKFIRTGDEPSDGGVKMYERVILDKIYEHLNNGYHPMTHDTDLILMRDLVHIMSVILPADDYFSKAVHESSRLAKSVGSMMSRDGVIHKLIGTTYMPVDKQLGTKGSNRTANIWVLRDRAKYKKLGPADLYREHVRQTKAASVIYMKLNAEQYPDETPYALRNVEPTVSFM